MVTRMIHKSTNMKFETTKQNRPKTPDGLTAAIERALANRQLVIMKIFNNKQGWAIAYQYASNSTLPPIKRLFKDTMVFRHYESIAACFKGEYDRVVLGIDDGHGTFNDAPVEKLPTMNLN